MKRVVLSFILVALVLFAQSQQKHLPVLNSSLKNYSVTLPYKQDAGKDNFPYLMEPNTNVVQPKTFQETIIGTTEFDVQSNKCIDSRLYLYSDGTLGAAWIYGTGNMQNRGTGYNYFDGTSWGPAPSVRIESVRTGWASYAPLDDGEVVIAHDAIKDLVMNTRPNKGTGSWTQTIIEAPQGTELTWPHIITVGNTIHVLSASYIDYANMKRPIIYSRSLDGGQTWSHQIIPGMDYASGQLSYSADIYSWAKPKNGKLAFIVGNMWHDVFIMKSEDNGDTWQKITVFQHPNPFCFDTGIPLDTTYVCDGLMAVEFDNNDKLHAVFGVTRVLVSDPSSEQFSWFPFTSYLAYWNEDMGTLTDMDIIQMDLQGRVIGWLMDLDGDGTIFANFSSFDEIKSYGNHGLVSQPQLTIDDNDNMYVVFAHVNETNYSGSAYYRHIWMTQSTDGGATWSMPIEITGGIEHEYDECVFPALAKNTDASYLHMIYQLDDQPGVAIGQNPDHGLTTNSIVYVIIPKAGASIQEHNTINAFTVYPNPASEQATVQIVSPIRTSAQITVTNITGQIVYRENVSIKAGNNFVHINVNNLPAGLYMVNVSARGFNKTQKLLVE